MRNMQSETEYAIDVLVLLKALWKNALVIALAAVLAGSAAFGVSAFVLEPEYQATASLYVNNSSLPFGSGNSSVSSSDLNASNSLVSVYLYILKSRTTLEEVISTANLSCTPAQLAEMVQAAGIASTGAFEITVTGSDPLEVQLIANTIADVLPDRISEIVEGSSVRVVDYAVIPAGRSGPDIRGNTLMATVIGAVLCMAVIVMGTIRKEIAGPMIRSASELRTLYPDTMVLAAIPDMHRKEKHGYGSPYCQTAGAEAYKRLRTNLLLALDDKPDRGRILGITSAEPSEGKSTTAIHLAGAMAELGRSVLLIDGDLRRPSLHSLLGVQPSPGLSQILTGTEDLENVILHYESTASFDLIIGGKPLPNPAELLISDKFRKVLETASRTYDCVILDLPPVNAVADAVSISKYTDGSLIVIRENHCSRPALAACTEQLVYAKANILGFVMNGCTNSPGAYYDSYYRL